MRLRSRPVWSLAKSSSQSEPQTTLMTFHPVDDARVAADGAVEALEVAVDDKDEVVELLAGAEADGSEGLDFIGLAVAYKGPDFTGRLLAEAAVFEVAHEARLINRIERANAHRDGGELPEILHEPGVGVAGKAGLAA